MGPVRSSPPSDRHAAELTLLSVRWFVPLMVVPAFLMLLIVARASTPLFLIEISWLGERAQSKRCSSMDQHRNLAMREDLDRLAAKNDRGDAVAAV